MRKAHTMTLKQGMPYQVHDELDAHDGRGGILFARVRGENDLYSVWHHTFTGNQHFYYLCDRMNILVVCGYEEMATVLYQYVESGIAREKALELLEGRG